MTREEYLKKEKANRILILASRFFILFAVIILWELLTVISFGGRVLLDPFFFSSPTRIMKMLGAMLKSGELWLHVWTTTYETVLGFIVGTALGCIIAVGLWWSERARKILDPYIVILNSLPKIALAPIIIVWVGIGTAAIVTITVLISLIITIITMLGGFMDTDTDKILLLQTMNASKLQILTKLVLPSSAPTFINALKINVGMAWVGSITGEYIVSSAGLGNQIDYGAQVLRIDLVMACIFLICVLSGLMYYLVTVAEKAFIKWK